MNFYKITTLLILLASSASLAGAQTLQERRAEIENRIESIREQASSTHPVIAPTLEEDNMKKACDVTTKRVDKRLEEFSRNYAAHEQVYATHVSRLETISNKLSVEGLDVTNLNTNIAVLRVKIDKFITDKGAVVSALEETKEFSCGDSNQEFIQTVQIVRDAQKMVFENAREISSFVKTVIKNDLEKIRQSY